MWTGANEKLPVDSNCGVTIDYLLNTRVLDVHRKDWLSFSKSDNNLVTCVDREIISSMKFSVDTPPNFLL
jgi:hypothetical protein